MDFKRELEEKRNLVEKELKKYLAVENMPQKRVFDAMSYSLMAGGKRLRPLIMLLACEMCGGNAEDAMPFACAMEMIHTYSLIHDDLPAMDNDDLRRGMPTNHVKFDEATAILAGDALLNMAFEITSMYENEKISDKNILKAVSVLARSAGARGMIGGQIIDMESENKKLTIDELKNLHALKTGAIIRASGVCGAILAGADEKERTAVDEYCRNLGIAFQIRDDILDVVGNEAVLGKRTGSDVQNNKNTYVSLTSIDEADKMAADYTEKAKKAIEPFGQRAQMLLQLADYLTDRNN